MNDKLIGAAQQAADALDACVTDEGPEQHELTAAREALKNLRAALAQQDAQAVPQGECSDDLCEMYGCAGACAPDSQKLLRTTSAH